MNKLIIALLLCLIASSSYAFEVDGFYSGMTKTKAKSMMLDYKFDNVTENGNEISVYNAPSKGNSSLYHFEFCKDKLFFVQKDYPTSIKNFILLAAELEKKYGNKVLIYPQPNQIGTLGEKHSLEIYFNDKNDIVTLRYNVFDTNDQISVTKETKNTCYKIPLNQRPPAR